MQAGAGEQGGADAAAAMAIEHRDAEFGVSLRAPDVPRADDLQVVADDAERRVLLEIDAPHVGAHRRVVERHAEAQPPVVGAEREEMSFERRAFHPGELAHDDVHATFLKASLAAASVASISAAPCAPE